MFRHLTRCCPFISVDTLTIFGGVSISKLMLIVQSNHIPHKMNLCSYRYGRGLTQTHFRHQLIRTHLLIFTISKWLYKSHVERIKWQWNKKCYVLSKRHPPNQLATKRQKPNEYITVCFKYTWPEGAWFWAHRLKYYYFASINIKQRNL